MVVGLPIPHERSLDDANSAREPDGSSFRKSRARRHLHSRRGPAGQFERADSFGAEKIFDAGHRRGAMKMKKLE